MVILAEEKNIGNLKKGYYDSFDVRSPGESCTNSKPSKACKTRLCARVAQFLIIEYQNEPES